MVVIIDESKCTGCSICVEACPVDAITVDRVAEIDTSACAACGSCIDECPNDALSMERIETALPSPKVISLPPSRPSVGKDAPLQALSRPPGGLSLLSRVNWAGVAGLVLDLFISRLATRGRDQGVVRGKDRMQGFGRGEGRGGPMRRGRGWRR